LPPAWYRMTEFSRRFAATQIVGARERQEDDLAVLDLSHDRHERFVFVVADGMGGHIGAAEASHRAVERFCQIIRGRAGSLIEGLGPALDGANSALALAASRDSKFAGAGCTFLAAAIENGELSWISVGDSSLYLLRHGELHKLNDDHSMRPVLAELVSSGRMTADLAARDPRRGALRSSLTGKQIPLIDNSLEPLVLNPGDHILLASDGLETLNSRAISRIIRRARNLTPREIVGRLLTAVQSERRRHQDNTTVILYCHSIGPGKGVSARGFYSGKALVVVVLSLIALIMAVLNYV
jgi:PPM family protein phosphatase